jgi:hypothetical protein
MTDISHPNHISKRLVQLTEGNQSCPAGQCKILDTLGQTKVDIEEKIGQVLQKLLQPTVCCPARRRRALEIF